MDLRPLSYEEMCQMELLHAAANANMNGSSSSTGTGSSSTAAAGGATSASTTPTMLPIMVIPTAMMPPGTILTAAPAGAAAGGCDNGGGIGGNCEHFYQLQPTHILTAATPTSMSTQNAAGISMGMGLGCGVDGVSLGATPSNLLQAHNGPTLLNEQQAQQLLQQQQLPHQQIPQQHAANNAGTTVNILYTGTLTKPRTNTTATLTRKALESSTLPRGFQPSTFMVPSTSSANTTSTAATNADESDFEGSECGASVSTTTCIPHFRFGGCGMILQPATTAQQQQHHQHHQHEPQQVIGCGSLSHMMGSFAAAAGGAMHPGRFTAMGTGLSGTLGRNRRSASCTDGTTQTPPKRVSFKGDNLPPEELQVDEGANILRAGTAADAFNNCSYMHFDNFMDYQVSSSREFDGQPKKINVFGLERPIYEEQLKNPAMCITTGFGGLPDVTEHSNIRRTLSRQNSISNSDSGGEIASIQKSKVNFADAKSPTSSNAATAKRKSKAAQHADNATGQHYKTRRSSCVLGLTLIAALCLLAIAATLAYQHFFMAPSRNSHAQRLRIVRRILREVPLVDGHNNFAWNVRKYAHSSLELVHLSHDLDHKSMWTRPAWAQTDMERLKQGLVGVQVWSAYVPCEAQGLDAVQLALEQIDIIRRLSDMYSQETLLVTTSKDITAARRRGLMASLIGIEGGHAIGSSLGVLRSFYSLGARYLSLTHKCDVSWAGSSASPLENGLTQFGKAIIREMNRLGMMIDLSYSSDATARDVLQVTRAPVIFSHSAARHLCNSTRNIPDDILRLVAENGGLIMVSFDSEDVACGRQARLKDVIEHIKYVRTIAGIQHIGLGAGYDGIELPPVGLEDVSKYPDLLATLLEDHNWSEEDIAMLAGKNFLRIMETVENVRDYWKRAAIQPIEQTEPQPKSQCTYMSS